MHVHEILYDIHRTPHTYHLCIGGLVCSIVLDEGLPKAQIRKDQLIRHALHLCRLPFRRHPRCWSQLSNLKSELFAQEMIPLFVVSPRSRSKKHVLLSKEQTPLYLCRGR